jgi:hypothetical protein
MGTSEKQLEMFRMWLNDSALGIECRNQNQTSVSPVYLSFTLSLCLSPSHPLSLSLSLSVSFPLRTYSVSREAFVNESGAMSTMSFPSSCLQELQSHS